MNLTAVAILIAYIIFGEYFIAPYINYYMLRNKNRSRIFNHLIYQITVIFWPIFLILFLVWITFDKVVDITLTLFIIVFLTPIELILRIFNTKSQST